MMTTKLSGVGRYVKGGPGNLDAEFAVSIDRFGFAWADWRYTFYEEDCHDCLDIEKVCPMCLEQFILDGWAPKPWRNFEVTVKH